MAPRTALIVETQRTSTKPQQSLNKDSTKTAHHEKRHAYLFRMSEPITIPPLEEIGRRIQACRDELHALKKLQRMALATRAAAEARAARQCSPPKPRPEGVPRP